MDLGMIGLGRMGGNMARRLTRDSGEGRWTVQAAVEEGVTANVLAVALFTRFRSRQASTFGEKLLSAMRRQFGGHREASGAGGER